MQIKHAGLLIENEYYLRFPNGIYCTRSWILKLVGIEATVNIMDFYKMINELELTPKELAAFMPFVLTIPG